MRPSLLLLPILLATACSGNEKVSENAVMPPLDVVSETPGDWSGLDSLIGRLPADSGLFENSPVSVDLNATLGPDLAAYRSAMMRSGPLRREGSLMVARAPDAWLVLDPEDHAFRAAMKGPRGWREWQTPGAEVPLPSFAGG